MNRTCYHIVSIRPYTCVPSPEALHTENPLAVSIWTQWLLKIWYATHCYNMEYHENARHILLHTRVWSQTYLHTAGKCSLTYVQKNTRILNHRFRHVQCSGNLNVCAPTKQNFALPRARNYPLALTSDILMWSDPKWIYSWHWLYIYTSWNTHNHTQKTKKRYA